MHRRLVGGGRRIVGGQLCGSHPSRMRNHCGAKSLGGFKRPRCKVQGVWAFFFGVHMFVADAVMPHDASMTCEVIARALEHCEEVAKHRGKVMPREFVLWTDNTTRENKNSIVLKYLAVLVGRGAFQCTALLNPDMGHSHNILDQCYGVITRAFQYVDRLEDLDAVVEALRRILKRPALRQWFGEGVDVQVHALHGVRDWKSWLAGLDVRMDGAMR